METSASPARSIAATFDEKFVLAKSPSLDPRPVKSNRSTAIPSAASVRLMMDAALTSFPQVKQCANSARARVRVRGLRWHETTTW